MATKKAQEVSPLDRLVKDPMRVVALVLWKMRFAAPELTVQITPQDIEAFEASVAYTKQVPKVLIIRPAGRPAQEAIQAMAPTIANPRGRAAQPARPAEPPRDYVVVQLVDADGNAIVPVESNEADYDRGRQVAALKRMRELAPELASRVKANAQGGTFSLDEITQLADTAATLARA